MQSNKLKKYQRISLLVFIFILMIYLNRNPLIYRNVIGFLETKSTKAVIISEKEGMRGSHLTGSFSYYYTFNVDDNVYKNPSYNENYKIGDSVKIIYAIKFPFINKIAEK